MCYGAESPSSLEAGQGVIDTTPPLGIELAGFHRPPGKERVIRGIRQATAARALVLRCGDRQAAIVSLDICAVSAGMAARVARRVAQRTGIAASGVRIVATHTHSMPTFRYLRQWGAVPRQYMAEVEEKVLGAVARAQADLAPSRLLFGRAGVVGGNYNRTSSTWKTDESFDERATEEDRWLDTKVSVLLFERSAAKGDLLWYHFCAHPVCYTDDQAGPDWPGLVSELCRQSGAPVPCFLQGHCGDVNPGPGQPRLGVPHEVAAAIHGGIRRALDAARPVAVDTLCSDATRVALPLDLDRLARQLAEYRKDPSRCTGGPWVDEGFAADWARSAARWDRARNRVEARISALRLGDVAMAFHPAELYSYYGLAIQRDSPCPDTLVVGYTDDGIGYLTDRQAFRAGEYAALTVPKILDLPPYRPEAASQLTRAVLAMLEKLT